MNNVFPDEFIAAATSLGGVKAALNAWAFDSLAGLGDYGITAVQRAGVWEAELRGGRPRTEEFAVNFTRGAYLRTKDRPLLDTCETARPSLTLTGIVAPARKKIWNVTLSPDVGRGPLAQARTLSGKTMGLFNLANLDAPLNAFGRGGKPPSESTLAEASRACAAGAEEAKKLLAALSPDSFPWAQIPELRASLEAFHKMFGVGRFAAKNPAVGLPLPQQPCKNAAPINGHGQTLLF